MLSGIARYPRLGRAAAVAGGVLAVLFGYAFIVTHGASGTNLMRTLLGFDYRDVARGAVVWQGLVLLGFAIFHARHGAGRGRLGAVGFALAALGLTMMLLGQISHNWIVDPHLRFESPWVQGGWLLRVYGIFAQIAGMLLYGAAMARAPLPAWRLTPLLNGALLALWLVLEVAWIPTLPEDTTYRELATVAVFLPYASTWLPIGLALRAAAVRPSPVPAS